MATIPNLATPEVCASFLEEDARLVMVDALFELADVYIQLARPHRVADQQPLEWVASRLDRLTALEEGLRHAQPHFARGVSRGRHGDAGMGSRPHGSGHLKWIADLSLRLSGAQGGVPAMEMTEN